MMTTPIVSVIVPVYNVSQYLDRCLDSLVNQTLRDIEIICINDASTDNSLEIVRSWEKKDDRIKVIDFPENRMCGTARNVGIKCIKKRLDLMKKNASIILSMQLLNRYNILSNCCMRDNIKKYVDTNFSVR